MRSVPASAYHAKLTWTPRWVIFVFLLSRLIGLILFFMKRRTVNLHVGLCEEHTDRRRMHLFGWGGTLGMSVLMGVGGAAMDSGPALDLAGLAFFAGLIGLALKAAVLRVHKVEGEQAIPSCSRSDAFLPTARGRRRASRRNAGYTPTLGRASTCRRSTTPSSMPSVKRRWCA